MTIRELLNLGTAKLKNKTTSPALDAEVLLSFVLKKSKEFLFANPKNSVPKILQKKYLTLINKRTKEFPVAYITGRREFFRHQFKVTEDVLIPQPGTEDLTAKTIEVLANKSNLNILDVGTGSGAIIITLAKELGNKHRYFACDISPKALVVAKQNAQKLKAQIRFFKSDLTQSVPGQFDVVVANLPYLVRIPKNAEVKFEPKLALLGGGRDGLTKYKQLIQELQFKAPQFLLLEVDNNKQKLALAKLINKNLPTTKFEIIYN